MGTRRASSAGRVLLLSELPLLPLPGADSATKSASTKHPPSLQTRQRPGQRLPWAQALLPSAPFLLYPSQASLPTLKSPNLPHKRPKPPKLPKALLLLPSVLKCLPMLSPKTPPLPMTLLPPTLDPSSPIPTLDPSSQSRLLIPPPNPDF